jgi:hypothetical protein
MAAAGDRRRARPPAVSKVVVASDRHPPTLPSHGPSSAGHVQSGPARGTCSVLVPKRQHRNMSSAGFMGGTCPVVPGDMLRGASGGPACVASLQCWTCRIFRGQGGRMGICPALGLAEACPVVPGRERRSGSGTCPVLAPKRQNGICPARSGGGHVRGAGTERISSGTCPGPEPGEQNGDCPAPAWAEAIPWCWEDRRPAPIKAGATWAHPRCWRWASSDPACCGP